MLKLPHHESLFFHGNTFDYPLIYPLFPPHLKDCLPHLHQVVQSLFRGFLAYQQAMLDFSQSAVVCKNIRKKNGVQTSYEKHLVQYSAYAYVVLPRCKPLNIPYILPNQRIQSYQDHLL